MAKKVGGGGIRKFFDEHPVYSTSIVIFSEYKNYTHNSDHQFHYSNSTNDPSYARLETPLSQSRKCAKLFLQSSELELPHPSPAPVLCDPPPPQPLQRITDEDIPFLA